MYQGKFSANHQNHKSQMQQEHSVREHVTSPHKKEALEDWQVPQDFREPPEPPIQEPPRKHRRGPWITGILFYLAFFLAIGGFYLANQRQLATLEQELTVYEQAQAGNISQQLFEELFVNPNWETLYDASGMTAGQYEGKAAFVQYMQAKVGDTNLSYRQLSRLQEEPLCYGVYLGEEQIAQFTMEDHGTSSQTPDWQLGTLTLFAVPQEHYQIRKMEGHTVKINGIALDDSHTIQTETFRVEGEETITIPGVVLQKVENLLVKPEVTIEDAAGAQMQVSYDETSRTFSEPIAEAADMGAEERQAALEAVEAYCKFMINKGGRGGLGKYFKSGTDTYKYITGSDLTWVQKEKGHAFANEEVTNYVRYDEDHFSAHVSLTFQLTRKDDTIKESLVEQTLFFERTKSGWICTRMTGMDLVKPVTMVRLEFQQDGRVLASQLCNVEIKEIPCPQVTAPEGKTFVGWMTQRVDEEGNSYFQRVLGPGENGVIRIPSGLTLEPMVLSPVFENA